MSEKRFLHLLIVDDNRDFYEELQESLEQESEIEWHITTVTNTRDAHTAVARMNNSFDVMVIDQQLRVSREDGIELMKDLLVRNPESAAIIMTANTSPEDARRALEAGADDYIYKSPEWPEIFSMLKLKIAFHAENRRMKLAGSKQTRYHSAFISYSSQDAIFARQLHNDLQMNGVRVWFAQEDLKIGDKFRSSIEDAIRIYDKLIVILSENSVTSEWVEREVESAFEKEGHDKQLVVFPIRLDDTVMETNQSWAADIRRTRHIGDFRNWTNPLLYQNAINRLLRDLVFV